MDSDLQQAVGFISLLLAAIIYFLGRIIRSLRQIQKDVSDIKNKK
jgi:hypothetical protein